MEETMKKKEMNKKLSFNKVTVSNLNRTEQENILGGLDTVTQCTYRMCTRFFICSELYDCTDLC